MAVTAAAVRTKPHSEALLVLVALWDTPSVVSAVVAVLKAVMQELTKKAAVVAAVVVTTAAVVERAMTLVTMLALVVAVDPLN
jgi:predicted RNA methylase